MTHRPSILVLNNYPIAFEGWREGSYPGHHLWGAGGLERYGFNVIVPPMSKLGTLGSFVQGRAPTWCGDCDQQIRAWLRVDYDLVYSACQFTTAVLARLRNIGLFHKPIVALVHHRISADANGAKFVAGHSGLPCLSRRTQSLLTGHFGVPAARVPVLDWGPDLDFYGSPSSYRGDGRALIVSVGKTRRDHDTLVAATRDLDVDVTIVGPPPTIPVSDRVKVIPVAEHGRDRVRLQTPMLPYRDVLALCGGARILAIPLGTTKDLAGLTSLLDAMGLGKPVIMTRNPYLEIDIETEGIGVWVDQGDVDGWRRAIRQLLLDPARAHQMGMRARALAARRFNMTNFTAQLAQLLSDVLADPARIGPSTKE